MLNENQKVRFYEPHDGKPGGPLVPLPNHVRNAANALDGKIMTLKEGLEKIQSEVQGELRVVERYQCISYKYKSGPFKHMYRLIKYEEING